jgi:hypothetical protein
MTTNKFTSPMDAAPVTPPQPQRPSAIAIRAVGRAVLTEQKALTEEQQRAWFGGVVFGDAPVSYNEARDVFIVESKTYTPDDVYAAVGDGRVLG